MKTIHFLIIAVIIISNYHLTAQVLIDTDSGSADPSAMLQVKSTTKGFLPPGMTAGQRDAISNPADGLMIYNTDSKSIQFFTNGNWHSINVNVDPVTLNNTLTGRTWMDRNLGASRAATSKFDTEAYGDLYQWGRLSDGHESRTSETTDTPSSNDVPGHHYLILGNASPDDDWRDSQNDNLWQGGDGLNNPCPEGFRIPTKTEWDAERQTWSSLDRDGAFGSQLKLPSGGRRNHANGDIVYVGYGYCWSSTTDGSFAINLNYGSGICGIAISDRATPISVRCIKDEEEFGVVYNPVTGRYWMDRNLGASRVATSRTDAYAHGDLYQWGRLKDWHEKRYSDTTYTPSSTDDPGHNDFILVSDSPYDWRDPQNNNLWQGLSGTNNPCPEGFRIPTEAEWEAERQTWEDDDGDGAFESPLKLSGGGQRLYDDGAIELIGIGFYWRSSTDGNSSKTIYFYNTGVFWTNYSRAYGISVRCIKD